MQKGIFKNVIRLKTLGNKRGVLVSIYSFNLLKRSLENRVVAFHLRNIPKKINGIIATATYSPGGLRR